jgi:RNA polymerase sigma factor (sigma-70 family)
VEASALQAPLGLGRISLSSPLLRLRSDDQLVALFRAGNEDAFRVIHDRYRQRLFAYTRQMLSGSRQDAEDALQDVFIRAYSSLRASDRPVALRAWLYRVAHNRCIDQLRRPVPPIADVFDASRSPMPDPLAEAEPPAPGPPGRFLYEPDPAVLRAGLVTTLAAQLGARQLDADIAYLAADDLRPTPFARAYEIDEAMPFQLKRLRDRLRALGVGSVTVKKRGSPLEPEDLIRQLKLAGSEERVVILTHVLGKAYALIGREAARAAG